ncbi:MAG: DNA internalization-related competence protein ComEC/Rec2 [Lachnospiraceae bacterium]|nr:DNA internalization-related competence protein ComEC/Rec2 [Lachnospiraceae bacterium]
MKRPLCILCLLISLFVVISTTFSQEKQFNSNLPEEGETISLTGVVNEIELKNMLGYTAVKVYLANVSLDDRSASKIQNAYMEDIHSSKMQNAYMEDIHSSKTKNVYMDEEVITKEITYEGVLLQLKSKEKLPHLGQRIEVSGKVSYFTKATNDGQFDERTYYKTEGMDFKLKSVSIKNRSSDYSRIRDALWILRKNIGTKIDEALPEDEASIMKTMLLGDKEDLDEEKKSLYQRTGIAHVLAISGLHVSLIGMGLFKILKKLRLGHKKSSLISILFVFFYGALTGFSVSTIRACVMLSISLIAVLLGRSYDLLTALSLIGCITLVREPLYIQHGGFAFSYGCVLGIGILMPTLADVKGKKKVVLSSLTMVVTGLPLYYWYFFQLPVYSVFLNFLVIPVMGVLVPCGITLLVGIYLFNPIANISRIVIVGILKLFEVLAVWADEMPGHFLTAGRPKIWQVIAYIFVLMGMYIYKKKLSHGRRCFLAIMAMLMLTLRFGDGMKVTFLDVGQGDSIILSSENRIYVGGIMSPQTILVDCGSSDVSKVGKYRLIEYLKYHGIWKVDMAVVTHPDEDHICGLREVINEGRKEGITISKIVLGDVLNKEEALENLIGSENSDAVSVVGNGTLVNGITANGATANDITANDIKVNGIKVEFIAEGDSIRFGDNGEIVCLNPQRGRLYGDTNESSVVLLGKFGKESVLLTGDVCAEAERRVSSYINSEYINGGSAGTSYVNRNYDDESISVLKVAHHGSKNSTTDEFLRNVKSKIAIISCGKNNSYGHPHKETLERLTKAGCKIFTTQSSGCITVRINKEGKCVVTEFK